MTDKIPEEFKKLSKEEIEKAKEEMRKSFDELSADEKNSLANDVVQILRDTLVNGKLEALLAEVVQGVQKKPDVFRKELEKKVK